MNWSEIRGLKYFIIYVAIVLGGYVYANSVGWKWLGSTPTSQEKSETHGQHGPHYFYHK